MLFGRLKSLEVGTLGREVCGGKQVCGITLCQDCHPIGLVLGVPGLLCSLLSSFLV